MKPLYISLTRKGDIDKAVKALKQYKQTLMSRSEIFVRRLAEIGIPVIDARITHAQGDSDPSHYSYIKVLSFGDYSEATLVVEGRDLLFLEFGAGAHFNGAAGTSKRPKEDYSGDSYDYHITGGEELGYTIGSYGKGQGKNDFWFYKADNGDIIMSHGTEAVMPLYHASIEIINHIEQIAREVYGNG